ncbi:catalase [Hathewaya limosa]|uniref:Catalase n=1 Tax=Hathewaya limosa TaxID=1536 RepID=A0ABU0JW84_HATLI|nr:catalase [Hathewaya limosa]MDQ0480428.1 catalase [Hathewaya limosa]
MCKKEYLTTSTGAPVDNNQSSLTVGARGPVLLQDIYLLDKLASFDRERIPERVVHAKGAGAHGYFKVYRPMAKYTRAKFLQDPNKKTDVFVRFSTVIGSKGSADTARDPRGFAVKFYTEEGNYDLAGNNIPVFFIRDAIKFPDIIHSLKPSPDTNLPDPNRFWDFISNSPEATHMIVWLYSDLGTRKSFRAMEGFGVNTYVWVNEKGKRVYVKYHWKPALGNKTIPRQEAELLAGIDPNVATRDLYDTLNSGKTVEYELNVQLMNMEDENNLDFDPLDDTKVWPEDKYPLMKVGKMVLNRAPDNFFEEVEQAAFCPSNLVPGIEVSNDKMLQGRVFAYADTQRHRIGPNFNQLKINMPKVPVCNDEQDGAMRIYSNKGAVNYEPNSLANGWPKEAPTYPEEPEYVKGKLEKRKIPLADDFKQAGEKYHSYTKEEKDHLISNLVDDLWCVDREIQLKVVKNFTKASKEFGTRVAKGLKIF